MKLTVDGKSYSQPLLLKMDPRVKTPLPGLQQQFTLSKALYDDILAAGKTTQQIRAAREQLAEAKMHAHGSAAGAIAAFDQKALAIEGTGGGGGRGGRGMVAAGPDTLITVTGALNALMRTLESADVTPTTQLVAAITTKRAALAKLTRQWNALEVQIRQANMQAGN